MRHRLQESFFHYGWLTPAVLPLAQVVGRTAVDIVFYTYLLWAVIATHGLRCHGQRMGLTLYVLMLIAFLLGMPAAEDSLKALEKWGKFVTHSAVLYFTLLALCQAPGQLDRLLRICAGTGLVLLTVLGLMLPFQLWSDTFDPLHQLKEDNLPLLTPFVLYALLQVKDRRRRVIGTWGWALASVAYIALSQGRAALLAFAVAVGTFGLLTLHWRPRKVLAVGLVVLVLGIALSSGTFLRGVGEEQGWVQLLDRFSSHRTQIWREALEHPPEPLWVGVGMGNLRSQAFVAIGTGMQVHHLHNVLLDVWYETGVLGLATLLVFLIYVLWRGGTAYRRAGARERGHAGVLLAGTLAILTAAMLSFSLGSKPFSIYLFMLSAGLLHLAAGPNSARH